jgi:hypothetical protein
MTQRETKNEEKFENAYELLKLSEPTASSIKKLEGFSSEPA